MQESLQWVYETNSELAPKIDDWKTIRLPILGPAIFLTCMLVYIFRHTRFEQIRSVKPEVRPPLGFKERNIIDNLLAQVLLERLFVVENPALQTMENTFLFAKRCTHRFCASSHVWFPFHLQNSISLNRINGTSL